jgi:hypothetical protein
MLSPFCPLSLCFDDAAAGENLPFRNPSAQPRLNNVSLARLIHPSVHTHPGYDHLHRPLVVPHGLCRNVCHDSSMPQAFGIAENFQPTNRLVWEK